MTVPVFITVEEIETGSFADGTTYCPTGVYACREAAEAAVREYNKTHGRPGVDGWNRDGTCLAIHELELEV